jgi:hypothetical protein
MGISRRNPRGNFNWQYRYLKRRAICCGQLDEPIVTNDCYHYFIFSDTNNFLGWTFDGLSVDGDDVGDNIMPSYGGFGNVWIDGGGRQTCIIGYIDPTPPPTPVIIDNLGNTVPIVWKQCCNPLTCLQVSIPIADAPFPSFLTGLDGYEINWLLNTILDNYDPSNTASTSTLDFILKRLYGPQCEFDVVAGPTSYTLYLRNIYPCNQIAFIDKVSNYNYFVDGSCTLPTCFCYEVIGIVGSCALDYTACDGTLVNATVNAGDNYSVCVLDNLVSLTCDPGNDATLNGPNVACNGIESRIPYTLGPIDGPTDVCREVASGGVVLYSYYGFLTVPPGIPYTYVWDVPVGCNIVSVNTVSGGTTFLSVTFDPGFTTGDINLTAYFGCNVTDSTKLTVGCLKCTYSTFFNPALVSPYGDLTGWTLNGNDLITELNALVNPLGGDVYYPYYDQNIGTLGVWFYYYDNVDIGPLTFVAPDSSTHVVNFIKNSSDPALSCDTVCYEIVTPTASEIISFDVYNPFNTLSCDITASAPLLASILSNDQVNLEKLFQLLYGPQVIVTVVSALGNDTITIVKAYDFTPPVLYDRFFTSYTGTYVTC